MSKINIKEVSRAGVHIFDTKNEMINFVLKFGFRNNDTLMIQRQNKKWIVWLRNKEE